MELLNLNILIVIQCMLKCPMVGQKCMHFLLLKTIPTIYELFVGHIWFDKSCCRTLSKHCGPWWYTDRCFDKEFLDLNCFPHWPQGWDTPSICFASMWFFMSPFPFPSFPHILQLHNPCSVLCIKEFIGESCSLLLTVILQCFRNQIDICRFYIFIRYCENISRVSLFWLWLNVWWIFMLFIFIISCKTFQL